jgi:hypothetical protein
LVTLPVTTAVCTCVDALSAPPDDGVAPAVVDPIAMAAGGSADPGSVPLPGEVTPAPEHPIANDDPTTNRTTLHPALSFFIPRPSS